MKYKKRRLWAMIFLLIVSFGLQIYNDYQLRQYQTQNPAPQTQGANTSAAIGVLETLVVKGRAPKTNYTRNEFGDGWQMAGLCNTRNKILARDMKDVVLKSTADCDVVSGILTDPYTGRIINFQRGLETSDDIQIDHVVALSDAWQKGAQNISKQQRILLANDGLNLLAVEGQANQDKSNADAASWLPPNKFYRCQYVARQIAVKKKYQLWVTQAEKNAMKSVLVSCPDQQLPEVIL